MAGTATRVRCLPLLSILCDCIRFGRLCLSSSVSVFVPACFLFLIPHLFGHLCLSSSVSVFVSACFLFLIRHLFGRLCLSSSVSVCCCVCLLFVFNTSFIPSGKFRSPYLSKVAAAASARFLPVIVRLKISIYISCCV